MITVRRLESGEAGLFRTLRLASLQQDPYAFGSTYESALLRSEESWREQAEGSVRGRDRATFVLFSDAEPAGIAALYRTEDKENEGELLQVWVRPDLRGGGAARILMQSVIAWAVENEYRRILAVVRDGNPRAVTFYGKLGFEVVEEGAAGGTVMGKRMDGEIRMRNAE